MHKDHTTRHQHLHRIIHWVRILLISTCILTTCTVASTYILFERAYDGKIYPNVYVDGIDFGGKSKSDIIAYVQNRNIPFETSQLELTADNSIATLSGTQLEIGYDADLSAHQAYLIGRSGSFLSQLYTKFFKGRTDITPYFRWNEQLFEETISSLASFIDVEPVDALFDYENGVVRAFRPSSSGRKVDMDATKKQFSSTVHDTLIAPSLSVRIPLIIVDVPARISTAEANTLGIKERIGTGYSEFHGSIPGRIHNVRLAASKFHGVLIRPGEKFSFTNTIGDISASTGYQSAYIIKDGRTILGDGGGVCQVSTTLFRAALNTGLPILERNAHAYRVHYYEEAGFKPGIDATIFHPSVDLVIQNDTPNYILIQATVDMPRLALTIDLYGTSDGRKAEILNHTVSGITPPPPPLYQDDPTLPPGVTKQVDWEAWGAQTSFQYKVTRDGKTFQETTFASRYRPWQAVYLRGVTP